MFDIPYAGQIKWALIVGILAGSHWWVYSHGKAIVEAERAVDRADAAEKVVTLQESYRLKERVATKDANDVDKQFQAEKRRLRAAADASAADAVDELQLLRGALAASTAASDPAATGRTDGADVTSGLLLECGERHQKLAAEATETANQAITRLTGLQSYVTKVCK